MNKYDILLELNRSITHTQRSLAKNLNISIGKVNTLIKQLEKQDYINKNYQLTKKGLDYINQIKPKKAIILAAGMGFRMIPINREMNKALIDVKGEILIERIIKQLHEVNITDISIVVGYMKESFEYLVDKFNIKLIVSKDYAISNSLHSLYYARKKIENCYIIPCDIYFNENPFNEFEPYSWYMISNTLTDTSNIKISKQNNMLIKTKKNELGNTLVGLAYISQNECDCFKENLTILFNNHLKLESFWEEALFSNMPNSLYAKCIKDTEYTEFNECSDLQKFDFDSKCLNLEVFNIIMQSLNITKKEITNITALKTGMTNNSFLFETNKEKYIMRIPGEGTEMLINRHQEGEVYETIKPLNISDPIIYFNPENGYKLTKFINNVHTCDIDNDEEIIKCMQFLRNFHQQNLKVNHEFNIFEKIEYYESLWEGRASLYKDYLQTKEKVYTLKKYINSLEKEYTLTHIDAVPDNFLIYTVDNKEEIRLIDWEYASMQDPHVDIAMFAIYAMYDKTQIDKLIDYYFLEGCPKQTRIKIYAYIACCGLLWSNWCEYKHILGIEFGEYSLYQYRYAKEYYNIVKEELGDKLNEL